MVALAVALLLGGGGCGGDPATRKLAIGEKAIVYDKKWRSALAEGFDDGMIPYVSVGTRVLVVQDDGGSQPDHRVSIKIDEGKYLGKALYMRRKNLRPAG